MNRGFMELSSFQDKAAATAGRRTNEARKGNPTDTALSALEKQVFRLHTEIEKYTRLADQVGTPRDTVNLRASISLWKDEIQRKAKTLKEQFSKANKTKHEMDTKQQDRLRKSVERFAQHLNEFQKALKICSDREVASPPIITTSAQVAGMEEAGESEHLLARQQQQEVERLDNMVTYNAAIIDERDTEIQGLVQDIGELNEMFQDVAVMVHDQGTMVDTVETNAVLTADRVQAGRVELEHAEKSQQAATSKKMCLAVVAGIIVGVIAAILILM